jgi:GT2 family glycosyltransferase
VSLRAQAEREEIDVVVVDNASTDGSAEMVEHEFAEMVQLIRAGSNIGFGLAANLGARASTARWIAVSNADVELLPNAISELIAVGEAHPDVGLLAPRLDHPTGARQESVFRFPRVTVALLAALGVHRLGSRIEAWMFRAKRWDPTACLRVEWAMGAFLLMRRAAFEEVGGFATDQWMYAEDLDLAWRLSHVGWSSMYVPSARVVHIGGAASQKAFGGASSTPQVVRAYYHWLRTRHSATRMWLFAAATLSGVGVRAVAYRLLAMTGRERGSYARARDWFVLNVNAAVASREPRV